MGGGRRQNGAACAVPAVVQQQRRQPRNNVHGGQGQKKQREGRHVVDAGPHFYAYEGDQQAPGPSAWRTFFAQTDPRRQKVVVGRLTRALLTEQVEWLTAADNEVSTTTADERVGELTAWVRARLRPILRHSPPSPQHHHCSDPSSSSNEEEASGRDDDDDDDEEEDEEEDDEEEDVTRVTNERKRNKRKQKAVDVEWEVQMKSVRLVAALGVICGREFPRRFIADAPLPATATSGAAQRSASSSQPVRTTVTAAGRSRTRVRAAYAEPADAEGTLGDLLMDVIRTVNDVERNNTDSAEEGKEEDARERRSALRVEALEALAAVCFILDDERITSDVCRFVAECYLRSDGARGDGAEVDALWAGYGAHDSREESSDDDYVSEEKSESESEEAESEPSGDEAENESDSEEKSEGRRRTSRSGRARIPAIDAAELAEALRVWTFLLSLLPQNELVCELVGPHKRVLVELVLLDTDSGTDVTASSEVRMHAAVVLTVLALSSGDDEDEDDEGDEQHSLDSDVMTNGDKHRLVAMCMEKARARAGERVRGRERRLSQKRERAWFRGLAAQLVDSLTTAAAAAGSAAGIATATSRKAKRDESGCEDHFHRQRQQASMSAAGTPGQRKVETHVALKARQAWYYSASERGPVHLNQLDGWRWRHVLSFLQRYFGSQFWTMFKARSWLLYLIIRRPDLRPHLHKHVREATKLLPAGSCDSDAWSYRVSGHIQLPKINKATLKGQKTQTKRYRRLTQRNPLGDDKYRQDKRGYVEHQSLTRWKKSITSEWQATSNAYFAW